MAVISNEGEPSCTCECGAPQDHEHLLVCPDMDKTCSWLDLKEANDKAIYVADYWKNNI
jgi:hypothetical protein